MRLVLKREDGSVPFTKSGTKNQLMKYLCEIVLDGARRLPLTRSRNEATAVAAVIGAATTALDQIIDAPASWLGDVEVRLGSVSIPPCDCNECSGSAKEVEPEVLQ
jgi:hypothetical protein